MKTGTCCDIDFPPEPAAEQEDRVMALNQALARTLVEPDAVELDKIEVEDRRHTRIHRATTMRGKWLNRRMTRELVLDMVRFGGDRIIPLGGVRGRTDRQTDTHTHRHTEGLPALII